MDPNVNLLLQQQANTIISLRYDVNTLKVQMEMIHGWITKTSGKQKADNRLRHNVGMNYCCKS
jgi:hypothetical protein